MKRAFLVFSFLFLLSVPVGAQEVAPVPAVETAAAPVPLKNVEWKANAGFSAILNSGNSSSETFGGNGSASGKWDRNKVTFEANGAYGRAEDKTTGVKSTNTKNWKTALRYDRYLADPVSIFALGHLGADEPAGFELRYGPSLGLAHEVWRTDSHFFKYEFGADYTHENRVVPPNQNVYSARTFLQYKYNISKVSVFGQDFETLFDLKHGKNVRINSLTSLTFKLTDLFGFQAGYAVRFDNVPVPGFKKTDTTTQFGLVASFI